MSYSAYVDEEFAGDVGTNTGIVALRQWAETVDGDALDELLVDGWTEAIGTAQAELAAGLADSPPADPMISTSAENLKMIIDKAVQAGAEVIVITDGADGVEIGEQVDEPTLVDEPIGENCGIGSEGFEVGNECAAGGGGAGLGDAPAAAKGKEPKAAKAKTEKTGPGKEEPMSVSDQMKAKAAQREIDRVARSDDPDKRTVQEHGDKWSKTLDKAERHAVRDYTSSEHEHINKQLRGCPDASCLDSDQRATYDGVNKAIDKSGPLPKPTTTYRGINMKKSEAAKFMDSMKQAAATGKHVSFSGIVSSSIDQETAVKFTSGREDPILKIKAKSGAYVQSISDHPGENELIQKHGTKYKVVKVSTDKVSGKKVRDVIHMEEI